jgi:membrane protease YdiL (CAAX protease family)
MSGPEIIAPLPQPVPPSTPRNTIFRGPHGLRAGWRIVIFLALVAGIAFTLAVLAGLVATALRHGKGLGAISTSGASPLGVAVGESGIFLVTALAALIMSRIEHRKFATYGLPARSAFGKNFWFGGLVGFAAITTTLLFIFAFHGFHLTGLNLHGSAILSATVAWGIAFIIVGLAEEFAFRGYLQYTLADGIGYWPAAVILSILFAAAHSGNPGESKFGLLYIVIFGLLFCLLLRRTGNLWWLVGFHAGWDWGQTFFYGVSDSGAPAYRNLFNSSFQGPTWLTGGSVGPEASIFTPITLILVGIIFSSVYRNNRYELPHSIHRSAEISPV